jgi:ankyrin repeat protein
MLPPLEARIILVTVNFLRDTLPRLRALGAQFGWTALHHSANWGYAECVAALLALGADPDARSESGKTAADAAAFKGFGAIAELLRQARPARWPMRTCSRRHERTRGDGDKPERRRQAKRRERRPVGWTMGGRGRGGPLPRRAAPRCAAASPLPHHCTSVAAPSPRAPALTVGCGGGLAEVGWGGGDGGPDDAGHALGPLPRRGAHTGVRDPTPHRPYRGP